MPTFMSLDKTNFKLTITPMDVDAGNHLVKFCGSNSFGK